MSTAAAAAVAADDYDRLREMKEFDDSKIGVRGLVESGAATIPRFFLNPAQNLALTRPPTTLSVPTVDLSHLNTRRRPAVVRQIADAARTWGFFQITNHGIPQSVVDAAITAVRSFHEQPLAVRSKYYTRDMGNDVVYNSNFDLFQSKVASWRDSLYMVLAPRAALDAEEKIPEICRRELVAWDEEVRRVGEVLMEVLSQGLGLERRKLMQMRCLEERSLVGQYYPYCPEAERTMGNVAHTDRSVLTVLVQSDVGGLEVKHGEESVQVIPTRGALVVNIGDLLQIMSNDDYKSAEHRVVIMSNDEYKSAEHRVVANPLEEPRISIVVFFNPSKKSVSDNDHLYGPFPELLCQDDKPARYRNFTMDEFLGKFFSRELDAGGLTNYFKLKNIE